MTSSSSSAAVTSDIVQISLEEEMKRSYLDYAMSVIVSRAIPDARDGLKPVHRRILYAMKESGNTSDKSYRKSASAVGYVMMKYHPHGNAPIYEAMVRMAQDFSMRLPLVDGQGNFGSMDGDPAAAERYTEARLAKVAHFLLEDIDRDTVDFKANYDESTTEPVVLPARFPNLLVNGAGGIAVGMATNIPPHNLGEVIDACCAYIDNPHMTHEDILTHVKGPDFPTGGIILGRRGIYEAATTGRGSILMRGRTHFEEIRKDRTAIIITEVPYQVNKARMIERMAEVVKEKVIEGISDLRDESDRDGVRVVIELKRDAVPDVVLNQLYRFTPLQTSFGVNSLALDHGQPRVMTILDVIASFIQFRDVVITRRLKFELNKARSRAHILLGLVTAVANIDDMIHLIKSASDPQTAREQLLAKAWPAESIASLIELVAEPGYGIVDGTYRLSDIQARAILDLRLHRLTGLERGKIADELHGLIDQIKDLLSILASREKLYAIIRAELIEVKEQFATPRRTTIEEGGGDVDLEDLIQCEDMVMTVSQKGYVKRVPLSAYRAQKRGGKGRSGMSTRDEDFVRQVFVTDTHTPVLFFSTKGIAYELKVYRLPLGSPQSLGKAMINLLPLDQNESIATILPLPKEKDACNAVSIVFATSTGMIRRNALSDFLNVRSNGKIAMKLEEENERLIGVQMATPDQDILLTTRLGRSVRFSLEALRTFTGRTSTGVRGIKLAKGDEVISISILHHDISESPIERAAYLKMARLKRGVLNDEGEDDMASTVPDDGDSDDDVAIDTFVLTDERFSELESKEQLILTVTDRGYGKRSSSYEYRLTNRGVQGFSAMRLGSKSGGLVDSFVVGADDQVVLVTDKGQLIRCPISGVRMVGRNSLGVLLFRVDGDESLVSVARIVDGARVEDGDNGIDEDNSDNGIDNGTAQDGVIPETDAITPTIPEPEGVN